MKIGVIAEDTSDVQVIKELTLKLVNPRRIGFKHFVGNGCGKLRRKCKAWAGILVMQGCPWIVLVHDLDSNNETQLRRTLEDAISDPNAHATVVLIPRREIEAWLLYDADALASAFNKRLRLKLPNNPEQLLDPKKHLEHLVERKYNVVYLNSKHNEIIARNLTIGKLTNSKSFAPHRDFVQTIRPSLGSARLHR